MDRLKNTVKKTFKNPRTSFSEAKTWAKNNKKKSILLGVVVLLILYFIKSHFFAAATNTTYLITEVRNEPITALVSGSGQVSSENDLAIKAQVSSTVYSIAVKAGQSVAKGTHLLSLDAKDANKTLRDAELAVETAQVDLDNAKTNYDLTKSAQDLALKNSLITLNSNVVATPDKYNSDTNTIEISGSYGSEEQGSYRLEIYACGDGACLTYSGLEGGAAIIKANVPLSLGQRGLFITFTKTPSAGEGWTIDVPSTSASGYIANYNSYKEKVESVKQAITSAEQNITAKKLALKQKQNALLDAQSDLSDYYITAPFAGTVVSVPVQVGEDIANGATLVNLITTEKIVTISLNEVDAAKVKTGDKVDITFDALPDVTLKGTVSELDELGIEDQGVVNYSAKVSFDNQDARVLAGMSATADVVYAHKDTALQVPSSAVKTVRGKTYVEVFDTLPPSLVESFATSHTPKEYPTTLTPKMVEVETGISNDTMTEITAGLAEGDKIVARTVAASTATATQAPSLFGGGTGGRTTTGGANRLR